MNFELIHYQEITGVESLIFFCYFNKIFFVRIRDAYPRFIDLLMSLINGNILRVRENPKLEALNPKQILN